MVDKPILDPQQFSKGGVKSVPSLVANVPNFRAAPSVTAFAADSIADTMVSMANDANRLQAMHSQNFNFSRQQTAQAQAEIEEAQKIEAEAELNKILVGSENAITEVRTSSDIGTVAEASLGAFDNVRDEILNDANLSAFQKKYLAPKIERTRLAVAQSATKFQTAARQGESRHTLQESMESREFLANSHPDQLELLLAEMTDSINDIGSNLPKAERTNAVDSMTERLTTAAVQGEIKTNPELAKQRLEAGLFNKKLDLNQIETLINDANVGIATQGAEQNKIAAAQRAEINASLGVAIAVGDLTSIPPQSQLDKLRSSGQIGDAQWKTLSVARSTRLKKELDKDASLQLGGVIFDNGLAVNPKNAEMKKGFNAYYENQLPMIAQMPLEQRLPHVANIITTHRAVPDLLRGEISLAATSGDPDQVAFVSDLVDQIAKDAPYLMDSVISTKERQRIDEINKRINVGMDFTQAQTTADQKLSIIAQTGNEAIKAELSELTKKKDFRKETIKAFGTLLDLLPGVGLDTSGLAADQISNATAAYRLKYEDTYAITRDEDLAERLAVEFVKGKFGRTSVNDSSLRNIDEVIEFPPENYYAIEGEDNSWMRKQMLSAAKEVMRGQIFDPNTKVKSVRLMPDPFLTKRGAAENRPGYNLVITGANGLPIRLNPEGQLFFFDQAKRKEDLVNEARGNE